MKPSKKSRRNVLASRHLAGTFNEDTITALASRNSWQKLTRRDKRATSKARKEWDEE